MKAGESNVVEASLRAMGISKNAAKGRALIVVELAYIDGRDRGDPDRSVHVRDAIQLCEVLGSYSPSITVAPVAFVNDLSDNASLCGIARCSSGNDVLNPRTQVMEYIVNELKGVDVHAMDLRGLEIYSMKQARNRIVKTMKRLLKRPNGPVYVRKSSDLVADVCVNDGSREIVVANKAQTGSSLLPRCTGIMAQHYRDVYMGAMKASQGADRVWICDFNRYVESSRVTLGAEVARTLFEWPASVTVAIANCVYNPTNVADARVDVTEMTE